MSLANLGLALGLMAGSVVFLFWRNNFATTGWLIAMLLSAIIAVPALIARYKLSDSPIFEQLKRRERLARLPSFGVFKEHATSILELAVVIAFQTVEGAVSAAYLISFMHFAKIPLATIAMIIVLSRIADVAGVLLSGPLADLCKAQSRRLPGSRRHYDSFVPVRVSSSRQAHLACGYPSISYRPPGNGNRAGAHTNPNLGELPDKIQILRLRHIFWSGRSPWRNDCTIPTGETRRRRCFS
jgi:hypothetical protein